MRKEVLIFDRNLLTEDVSIYDTIIGKRLIVNDSNELTNILKTIQNGNSFIYKNTEYIKRDGLLYRNVIEDNQLKLKEIKVEDII